ncbi:ABC transporter substrate-binding protein [Streptomyces sp. NPDC051956]|uniref:ABC transporter substrate-binding protein n=1 Tax=Streptomyces sp. NPDC051956 TaxID=3365677 RepID=UPI0037CE007F
MAALKREDTKEGEVNWASWNPEAQMQPAIDLFEKNFVYVWATPKVWAYDTDKVKPADVPKTWNDLLDRKWSGGNISAESRASFMSVWDLADAMGETKALAWAKKFAALKPHYSPNVTQAESPIESGQVSIGTSLASLVLAAKDKGAPIDIAPISPTSASESYLYIPKGAQHPAAAALLTSFLSSDDAQKLLAKSYNSRIPVDTDCSDPENTAVLQSLCKANLKWYGTKALKKYNALSTFYRNVSTTTLGHPLSPTSSEAPTCFPYRMSRHGVTAAA